MLNDTTNNYLKACEDWRLRFLTMDQAQLKEKLPELEDTGDYLSLSLFDRKFGVHKESGHIVTLADLKAAERISQLNIYTLFGFVKPGARFLDNWVPFRELSGASPFSSAFEKHVLTPFAETFCGQAEQLAAACEALGGVRLGHSEVGYQLASFACIPLRFLFWDGDDEFPAQGNILYDRSANDFIHVESTVSLAMEGIERLIATAGIPAKGAMFQM